MNLVSSHFPVIECRIDKPTKSSLSLHDFPIHSSIIFVALLCTFSSKTIYFTRWGLQAWMQYFKCGLTKYLLSLIITSFFLQVIVLFLSPSIWFSFLATLIHCFDTLKLLQYGCRKLGCTMKRMQRLLQLRIYVRRITHRLLLFEVAFAISPIFSTSFCFFFSVCIRAFAESIFFLYWLQHLRNMPKKKCKIHSEND